MGLCDHIGMGHFPTSVAKDRVASLNPFSSAHKSKIFIFRGLLPVWLAFFPLFVIPDDKFVLFSALVCLARNRA
jgi:hypothetical protein